MTAPAWTHGRGSSRSFLTRLKEGAKTRNCSYPACRLPSRKCLGPQPRPTYGHLEESRYKVALSQLPSAYPGILKYVTWAFQVMPVFLDVHKVPFSEENL